MLLKRKELRLLIIQCVFLLSLSTVKSTSALRYSRRREPLPEILRMKICDQLISRKLVFLDKLKDYGCNKPYRTTRSYPIYSRRFHTKLDVKSTVLTSDPSPKTDIARARHLREFQQNLNFQSSSESGRRYLKAYLSRIRKRNANGRNTFN